MTHIIKMVSLKIAWMLTSVLLLELTGLVAPRMIIEEVNFVAPSDQAVLIVGGYSENSEYKGGGSTFLRQPEVYSPSGGCFDQLPDLPVDLSRVSSYFDEDQEFLVVCGKPYAGAANTGVCYKLDKGGDGWQPFKNIPNEVNGGVIYKWKDFYNDESIYEYFDKGKAKEGSKYYTLTLTGGSDNENLDWQESQVWRNPLTHSFCTVKIEREHVDDKYLVAHIAGKTIENLPVMAGDCDQVLFLCNADIKNVCPPAEDMHLEYWEKPVGKYNSHSCLTFKDETEKQVIIVAGGYGDPPKILHIDDCIAAPSKEDPACDWIEIANLSTVLDPQILHLQMSEAVTLNGKPVLIGGHEYTNAEHRSSKVVLEYDIKTDSWTKLPDLQNDRVSHTAVVVPTSFLNLCPTSPNPSTTTLESSSASSTLPATTPKPTTLAPTTSESSSTVPSTSTAPTTSEPSSTVPSTSPTTSEPSSTVPSTSPTTSEPSSTVSSTSAAITTSEPSSTVPSTSPTTTRHILSTISTITQTPTTSTTLTSQTAPLYSTKSTSSSLPTIEPTTTTTTVTSITSTEDTTTKTTSSDAISTGTAVEISSTASTTTDTLFTTSYPYCYCYDTIIEDCEFITTPSPNGKHWVCCDHNTGQCHGDICLECEHEPTTLSTLSTTTSTGFPTTTTKFTTTNRYTTSTTTTTSTTSTAGIGCQYTDENGTIQYTVDCIPVPCPEGTDGTSTQCCDEDTWTWGLPDTTDCLSEWAQAAEDMFASNSSGYDITQYINETIDADNCTAGDVIHTIDLLEKILQRSPSDDESEDGVVDNIVGISSTIIMSESSWLGMSVDQKRYETASKLVSNVEEAGFQFLNVSKGDSCVEKLEKRIESPNIGMSMARSKTVNLPGQYRLKNASITVPPNFITQIESDCVNSVATNYIFNNSLTEIFPSQLYGVENGSEGGNFDLVGNILGFSVNSKDQHYTLRLDEQPFYITFEHQAKRDTKSICTFWRPSLALWDTEGCSYNYFRSNSTHVTCDCFHLTNFGIMVDFMGNTDPNDKLLSTLSTVLLSTSAGCIIILEMIKSLKYLAGKSRNTRVSERQRNLWLCLGQLSFLLFVSQKGVDHQICQIYGALTHLVWTLYFCWSGICGYSLSRRVTSLLTAESVSQKIILPVSYFIPFVIVGTTLAYSLLAGKEIYLYRYNGEVAACWLTVDYIMIFLVPVSLVLLLNMWVLYVVVKEAYDSAVFSSAFTKTTREGIILRALRNTVILSVILGLGWIMFVIPVDSEYPITQYMFVIINTTSGIMLLVMEMFPRVDVRMSEIRLTLRRLSKGFSFQRSSQKSNNNNNNMGTNMGTTNMDWAQMKDKNIALQISESSAKIILKLSIDKADNNLSVSC